MTEKTSIWTTIMAGEAFIPPISNGNGHQPASDPVTAPALPDIVTTGRPMRELTDAGLVTLARANASPTVFVRSGQLVRIRQDEKGLPVIETLSEAALRGRLERRAQYLRIAKTSGEHVPIAPPLDVVRDILALGTWPFPALVGIVESPTIRPDGGLIITPGYDHASHLYYAPSGGLSTPLIPERPTDEQRQTAIDLLREVICDFPFEDEASRANALATILTPVLRPLVPGPVPLALIDKPQPGTGASLLAEVVALIATGRPSAMFTAPAGDESWKKEITALLLQGRTVITIDNIEGKLFAPSLAAVLTASTWEDRLLGQSKSLSLEHRATWMGTGNNIRLGGDLPRRCYWTRMDAQAARPWQRTSFKHPHLVEWVKEQRGAMIAAILTVARAWIIAGRPKPADLPTVGGFESWVRIIGGILSHARVPGFLRNLDQMYELTDDDTPQWDAFIFEWYCKWAAEYLTVAAIAKALPDDQRLCAVLPDDLGDGATRDAKGFTRKLGKALARRAGMRFTNGLCLKRGATEHKAATWQVVRES